MRMRLFGAFRFFTGPPILPHSVLRLHVQTSRRSGPPLLFRKQLEKAQSDKTPERRPARSPGAACVCRRTRKTCRRGRCRPVRQVPPAAQPEAAGEPAEGRGGADRQKCRFGWEGGSFAPPERRCSHPAVETLLRKIRSSAWRRRTSCAAAKVRRCSPSRGRRRGRNRVGRHRKDSARRRSVAA